MPLNVDGYEIRERDVRMYEKTSIVRDSLAFHLDASVFNTVTYGTTWFDLSGNEKIGSINNGISYVNENGGVLRFDGVNDYVNFGTGNTFFPLPQFTINIWFRSFGTTATTGTSPGLFGFTYGIRNFVNSSNLSFGVDNGSDISVMTTTGSIPFRNSDWYNATFYHTGTEMGIYINGAFNNSTSRTWSGTTRWPTNSWNLGRDNNNSMYFFRGDVAICSMYRRALSAAEVAHNYNVTKGRFGL